MLQAYSQKLKLKGLFTMKKLALIIAAMLAVTSVMLTSCNNTEQTPDSDKDKEQVDQVKLPGGILSFSDARKRLAEVQPKEDLDNDILLTAGGIDMSAASVKHASVACNSYYAPNGNPDAETQKQIDGEIRDYFVLNAAVINLAAENSIGITEEEFQTNVTDQIEYFKSVYGDDYKTIINDYTQMTPFTYFENVLYNLYYAKLTDAFYGKDGKASDKAEMVEKAKQEMDGKYVRAKHILIQFPDSIEKDEEGNILPSAKAETLAKANDILAKVNAGEDFDTLIEEYGQDPGMESNPDGYYFTKGEMVAPFEESAFSLEEGQTSGLVETSYGYHILKKLPITDDNDGFFTSAVYQELANTAMTELVRQQADKYDVKYSDSYKEKESQFLTEYYAANAAEAQ